MRNEKSLNTIRTTLAASVAALALAAPGAVAQDRMSDDAQMNAPVDAMPDKPVTMPEIKTEPGALGQGKEPIGDDIKQGAEDVAEAVEDGVERTGNAIEAGVKAFAEDPDAGEEDDATEMAEQVEEGAEISSDTRQAVNDPDVWNPDDIDSADKTELANNGATMYIIPSAANVRSGPGVSHEVSQILYHGDDVTIYETKGNWTRISADADSALWIYSPLLSAESLKAELTPTSADTPEVDEDSAMDDQA